MTTPQAGLLKRIKKAEREVSKWPKWLRQALCLHSDVRKVPGVMYCWECTNCGVLLHEH